MADVKQILCDLLNTILDEKNYKHRDIKLRAITSGGANYTSAIFLITVNSPGRDDLKLFAKVAIVGETMRKLLNADWLFSTERFVYTKLRKIYNDIQDKYNIPHEYRYIFPKFYGYKGEFEKETIIMENLVENGYKSYSRFKSMDWEHASIAVANLARFHALSFELAASDPEEFKKLTKDMKFELGGEEDVLDENFQAFWKKRRNCALEHVQEDHKDAVMSYFMQNPRFKDYNKPIGKAVIAHGDYRMSNILFRKQDTLEAITVDYQTVHAGNPAADLIYFIFLGSDEEFRREYYDKLLDHYYQSLKLALQRLDIDPAEVYPRTKFDSDMKLTLPAAVLIGVGVLPIVTVEAESAPRVDGDADVKDFILKPTELYAERFRGIVNDCIRLGAI